MKSDIDVKLKMIPLFLYGLQWWVVCVPSIVVMGLVVANLHFGADIAAQTLYMQKLFGITGLSLIVQVFWGHKLPLVAGPASVLLIGILSSVSSGVPVIYTAILIGGTVMAILAFSGMLKRVQSVFTPRVVVVILLLVAITVAPVIIKLVFGNGDHSLFNLIFALGFLLALIVGNNLLKGIWKSTTLVWGIAIGTAICFIVTGMPSHEGVRDMAHAGNLFLLISPEFDAGVVLSFLFCMLALIVNELGSVQAVGQMLNANQMERRTTRGVGITGLINMLSGAVGVIGSVDYSTSPGIISATGCASRYPLIPAGAGLIACAFLPSVVSGLLYIPSVVMGTLLLYIMSSQLAAALQMLSNKQATHDYRSGLIVGLPVMIALLISFAPAEMSNRLPSVCRPIVSNGFVMGVIVVLLMEHFIFRKTK